MPLAGNLHLATLCSVVILAGTIAHAQTALEMDEQEIAEIIDKLEIADDVLYVVRMNNGDMLSGPLTEISKDEGGDYIRIAATIGKAKIYIKEIAHIGTERESYRHYHRGFILPTAVPISNNHFVGLWEGVFAYGGFGIGDIVSVTAGRTLVPGIEWGEQFSNVNVKAVLYRTENGLVEGGEQFWSAGFNGAWVNDVNFIGHIFAGATFTGKRTQVTTMLFAKVAGKDNYIINAGSFIENIAFPLNSGTAGISLSLDSRFPSMHDLHFIGEVHNADLTRPNSTILYLGLRLGNTKVSMDTGIAIAPGPTVVPGLAFAWTPW